MAREDKSEKRSNAAASDAIIFHGRTDLRPDNFFVRCAAADAATAATPQLNQPRVHEPVTRLTGHFILYLVLSGKSSLKALDPGAIV